MRQNNNVKVNIKGGVMSAMRYIIAVMLAITLAGPLQSVSAQEAGKAQGAVDARALDILKKMSDTLSKTRGMSFQARSMGPVKAPSGVWVNLFGNYSVKTQSPDKLFVKQSGDLTDIEFYYDGKSVTMFSPVKNLYSVKDAPGSVNDLIEEGYKAYGKSFPFSDFLVTDPYAVLTKDMTAAYYVGESTIVPLRAAEGIKTYHLAVSNKGVEWQIWIDQKSYLPLLVSATYPGPDSEPSYYLELGDWKTDEAVSPNAFVFDNKTKASKTDYRDPFVKARPGPKEAAGAKAAKGE